MSAPDLKRIEGRANGGGSYAMNGRLLLDDVRTLLAEVKRLTAERDEARAALAELRGDVEALADEGGRSNRHWNGYAVVKVADLAAVLANHPTTKEADRG